jgi:ATP synthase F1 gamma subunit
MPELTELREELTEITTLKYVSAAFLEAASARIVGIRKSFMQNQEFYEDVSHIYHTVKVSSELLQIRKKTERQPGKVLSVAATSNHRFYGLLNINVMKSFIENSEKKPTDRVVIGKTGSDYLMIKNYKQVCEKVIFLKDNPNNEEIRQFLNKIQEYEKVILYFPKFVSMVSQSVGILDITQSAKEEEITEEEIIRHIFEPDLPKMVEFFERVLRTLLFSRAMMEADLSRTAARLMSMSSAEDRADELITEKQGEIRKARRTMMDKELLDTFAGMKKWGKN